MSKRDAWRDSYRENGQQIARIRDQLVEFAHTHHDLEAIDRLADRLINQAGGVPAFKRVPGYHWATCISANSQIVHGIPKGSLKPGDLVTIDTGMYLKGTTTDAATTFVLGQPSSQQKKFLDVGKKALRKAINKARINARVKDISQVLQTTVEAAGYTVSRTLTGHGLGETMHEDPPIPCFVSSDPAINTRLKENMILAIEIMYMAGDWPLVIDQDGWTLYTKDGSDSAVFEEDVLITADGPEVITNPSLLEPEGKV